MTIQNALERLDSLKYNTYTDSEKITWLDRLDRTVKAQVIDTHEGGPWAAASSFRSPQS